MPNSKNPVPMGMITVNTKNGQINVKGPHGETSASAKQPMEVGLAVIEAMTGSKLAQPAPYRKD